MLDKEDDERIKRAFHRLCNMIEGIIPMVEEALAETTQQKQKLRELEKRLDSLFQNSPN